VVKKCSLRKL
jgi:crotonobetainyl-CoA:carnitine CoA-transferase CaiB-like acyl-CoA transferase